jgi:hypothetical protein
LVLVSIAYCLEVRVKEPSEVHVGKRFIGEIAPILG